VSFFLCWLVLYTVAPVVQTAGGVSVYICVCLIWPCTAHGGPHIANSICPPSLGLEEYTGIIPQTFIIIATDL
jgi:hypothetical protein